MATFFKKYTLMLLFIITLSLLSVGVREFISADNIQTIFRYFSFAGLLSIGLTVVIISGEFDISFSAIASLSGIIAALIHPKLSLPVSWGVALFIGSLIGYINAVNTLYLKVPSFIATLGMMTILNGLADFITGGHYFVNPGWSEYYGFMGQSSLFSIPIPFILYFIIFIILTLLIEYGEWGRRLYAVGENRIAARYSGIDVFSMKRNSFIISGTLASLTGLLTGSQLGVVEPLMCDAFTMPVVSAVFLGAVFLKEGIPNLWGSALACILMVCVLNGMGLYGSPEWIKILIQGIILLIGVGIIASLNKGCIPTIKI
jgi:ribose transport system permease protein